MNILMGIDRLHTPSRQTRWILVLSKMMIKLELDEHNFNFTLTKSGQTTLRSNVEFRRPPYKCQWIILAGECRTWSLKMEWSNSFPNVCNLNTTRVSTTDASLQRRVQRLPALFQRMTVVFDLESLVHVEQTYIPLISLQKCKKKLTMTTSFYDSGYQDGFAHGRIHGLIEGRALGREKGFEIWEEIGFYEGFALTWMAILRQQSKEEELSWLSQSVNVSLICFVAAEPPSTSDIYLNI